MQLIVGSTVANSKVTPLWAAFDRDSLTSTPSTTATETKQIHDDVTSGVDYVARRVFDRSTLLTVNCQTYRPITAIERQSRPRNKFLFPPDGKYVMPWQRCCHAATTMKTALSRTISHQA
jgi:hypothetical protein